MKIGVWICIVTLSVIFDIVFVALLLHHDGANKPKDPDNHLLILSLFGGTCFSSLASLAGQSDVVPCKLELFAQVMLPCAWCLPLLIYAERHLRRHIIHERLHSTHHTKRKHHSVFDNIGKGIRRLSQHVVHPNIHEKCQHIDAALRDTSKYIRDHRLELLRQTIPFVLLHLFLFVGILLTDEADHTKKHSRICFEDTDALIPLWASSWFLWLLLSCNTARKLRHFHDAFGIIHELKLILVFTCVVVGAQILVLTLVSKSSKMHLLFLLIVFVSGYWLGGHPAAKLTFPRSSVKYVLQKVHIIEGEHDNRENWGLEQILETNDGYAYFARHLKTEFTSE